MAHSKSVWRYLFGSISRPSKRVLPKGDFQKMVATFFSYENFRYRHQVVHGFIEFLWRIYCRNRLGYLFGSISSHSVTVFDLRGNML